MMEPMLFLSNLEAEYLMAEFWQFLIFSRVVNSRNLEATDNDANIKL